MSEVIVPSTHFGSAFLGHWYGCVKYGKAGWYKVLMLSEMFTVPIFFVCVLSFLELDIWNNIYEWTKSFTISVGPSLRNTDFQHGLFTILFCFVLIAFVLLLILSLWWMRWKRLWSQILRKWSWPCWWHLLNMMLLKWNKPWRYNFWLFLLQYVAKNLLNNTRMLLIIRVLGQMRPSWMKFWGPDQTRRLQHWRLLSKKVSRKMYIHTVHVHSKTRGSC